MGLLGKISQKMGDAMEKSATKNMTGSSKEVYDTDKNATKEAKENDIPNEMIEFKFDKKDLNDLESLLIKGKFIDEQLLWIAGFPNFRANQNAIAANLLSGKKNLKFLCVNQGIYYCAHFEKNLLRTYKVFKNSDVKKYEVKSKLLGSTTFKIEFNDNKVFTIAVTENKDKVNLIHDHLE